MDQPTASTCKAHSVLNVLEVVQREEATFIWAVTEHQENGSTREFCKEYQLKEYRNLDGARAALEQIPTSEGAEAALRAFDKNRRGCLGVLLSCITKRFRKTDPCVGIGDAENTANSFQDDQCDWWHIVPQIASSSEERQTSSNEHRCLLQDANVIILIESMRATRWGVYATRMLVLTDAGFLRLLEQVSFDVLVERKDIARKVRQIMGDYSYAKAESMHSSCSYFTEAVSMSSVLNKIYDGFPLEGTVRDARHLAALARGEQVGYHCLVEAQECI